MRMTSVTDYFLSRPFLLFVMLCGIIAGIVPLILMLNAGTAPSPARVAASTLFFLPVATTVILGMAAVGLVMNALERRKMIRVIYTPVFYLGSLAVLVAQFYAAQDAPSLEQVTWACALFAAIFACLDIMLARFVAPLNSMYVRKDRHVQTHTAPSMAAPAAPTAPDRPTQEAPVQSTLPADPPVAEAATRPADPDRVLRIGSKNFTISEICQIQSEDHYLNIRLTSGSDYVRGKLSEVAAQLPVDYGSQVNRSTWIAYSEVESFEDMVRGRLVMNLRNGDVIVVPKMRKLLLEQRLRAYFAPHVSCETDSRDAWQGQSGIKV